MMSVIQSFSLFFHLMFTPYHTQLPKKKTKNMCMPCWPMCDVYAFSSYILYYKYQFMCVTWSVAYEWFFLCIGIVSISDPRTMLEPVIFKSTKIKCKYMSVIETVWIFIKSNTDWWSFRPVSSYSKLLVFSDSRHEVERM